MEGPVTAEHRRLDVLLEAALAALASEAEPDAARGTLGALRAALETHFDQESRLYFPAIEALRPDLKPDIQRLLDAHGSFRRRLDHIETRLSERGLAEAHADLQAFSRDFSAHEAAEEAMLVELTHDAAVMP